MRRILAITAIRSDYDLMSGLYRLLADDPQIDLRLLVAGTHLSATFGRTVDLIRKDGFRILAEVESLLNGDTRASRLKSASIMLQGAVDPVAAWTPDLILYAGDREDVLVGGMLGTYLGIPTIHFFGGDHEVDGHADTVVRHAASKLSTYHVVSIEQHRRRLLRMGESADRIFVAGSVALDKFRTAPTAGASETADLLPQGKNLQGYAMVIYHPLDRERAIAGEVFERILQALRHRGVPAIVSHPNSDPGNQAIIERIARYADDRTFWFYGNLGRDQFLALYRRANFLIGNSSSGILEAASIPLGVVNVGLRQRGRLCGDNVLFCGNAAAEIEAAIDTVRSPPFQAKVAATKNLYGDGASCRRVYDLMRATDFHRILRKVEDPMAAE